MYSSWYKHIALLFPMQFQTDLNWFVLLNTPLEVFKIFYQEVYSAIHISSFFLFLVLAYMCVYILLALEE